MSAADKRVAELLDRWLASLERHTSYLDLDDAAYAKVQDWPRHQRPTRWVVDVAKVRLQDLRRQLAEQQAQGNEGFAESLELMGFLTTMLGSEHVERFIPQAIERPAAARTRARPAAPRPATARAAEPGAPEPTVIRPRTPRAAPARPAKLERPEKPEKAEKPEKPEKAEKPGKPDKVAAMVIADAARLLSWGREWPQLAGLITRLADRPPEDEVWTILRTYRAAIESKARRAPD
jgi:hypothetical protein